MKDVNKIAQINIYIASKVLRNKKEKGMEEDLKKINDMFEKEDFSGLDEIYKKYFIPSDDASKREKE